MFKKEIIEKLAKDIEYTGDIDSLIMGIYVEFEHALGGTIAYNLFDIAMIAKAHLEESDDYYEEYSIYFDEEKIKEIDDKYIEDIATEIDYFGDKDVLRDGIYIEIEHNISLGWNLIDMARIAKDHIEQHGNDYYVTLKRMEDKIDSTDNTEQPTESIQEEIQSKEDKEMENEKPAYGWKPLEDLGLETFEENDKVGVRRIESQEPVILPEYDYIEDGISMPNGILVATQNGEKIRIMLWSYLEEDANPKEKATYEKNSILESRGLTQKQKHIIEKAVIDGRISGVFTSWEDFPQDVIDALEKINDSEILWMESQRYAHDFKRKFNAKVNEGVDYDGLEHKNKTPRIQPGTPKQLSKEDLETWKEYGYSWKAMQSAIVRNPREISDMKIGGLVNEIKKLSESEMKEFLSLLNEDLIGTSGYKELTDEEIEDSYADYKIVDITVFDGKEEGVKSGYIEIEFKNNEDVTDSWIKYPNGKIAFDGWYPDKEYFAFVDAINKKINELSKR